MSDWVDHTDSFTDEERLYRGLWLDECEVLDEVECNLFIPVRDGAEPEIYINFGHMFGIIYPTEKEMRTMYETILAEFKAEYEVSGNRPSSEFVNSFCKRYDVCIPNNMFFGDLFESLMNDDLF